METNVEAIGNPRLHILRLKMVLQITGLSKSTVYDKLKPTSPRFDPTFPKQVRISEGIVGWISAEVEAWIQSRVVASRV